MILTIFKIFLYAYLSCGAFILALAIVFVLCGGLKDLKKMIQIAVWTPGSSLFEIEGTYCGKMKVLTHREEKKGVYLVAVKEDAHHWYAGRSSYGSRYAPATWYVYRLRRDPTGRDDHWRIEKVLKWTKDSHKEITT